MLENAFPLEYKRWSLDHQGGTKSYHFHILHAASGRSLVVFRYGKKNAFGQLQTVRCNSQTEAHNVANKKDDEKSRKGYGATGPSKSDTISDWNNFQKVAGAQLARTIPKGDWDWLNGGAGADVDEPYQESDQARERREKAERDRIAREQLEELQRKQEAEEQARATASIPNWGRF